MVAEEYGIPAQTSRKLVRYSRANENLDDLMQGFKALDLSRVRGLTPFEKEIVGKALGTL